MYVFRGALSISGLRLAEFSVWGPSFWFHVSGTGERNFADFPHLVKFGSPVHLAATQVPDLPVSYSSAVLGPYSRVFCGVGAIKFEQICSAGICGMVRESSLRAATLVWILVLPYLNSTLHGLPVFLRSKMTARTDRCSWWLWFSLSVLLARRRLA